MKRRLVELTLCVTTLGSAACASGNNSSTPTTPPTAPSTQTIDLPPTAPSASASSAATTSATDAGATTPTPDSQDAMCGGSDIDLAAVLANKQCRPSRDAAPTPSNAIKDVKVTLTSSDLKIAPGGHVELALQIENTSASPIPLYFSGDLTLTPEVKDAKGTRIAPPSGNAPKNADPQCANKDCRLPASHIVLAPGGKAHAKVGFDAVKVAWPTKGPTTCCTIHVDSVAKGPLAPGAYNVKIPLPYESNEGNPADPQVTIRVGK